MAKPNLLSYTLLFADSLRIRNVSEVFSAPASFQYTTIRNYAIAMAIYIFIVHDLVPADEVCVQVLSGPDEDRDDLDVLLVKDKLHLHNLLAQPEVPDEAAVEPGLADVHVVHVQIE